MHALTLTRRRFLGAGAAAAALMVAPGRPSAAPAPVVLRPGPATAPLKGRDGPETAVWAYGGGVPGPVIRARRGETVRVRLENGLSQPTSVHWHGIRIANAMDGVAGLTQDPVAPGAAFDYEFTVPDAGTFWYHPHHRSWEQMARGLYGLLIVDEETPPAVDGEIAFVADDWRLTKAGAIDEASFGNLGDWSHAGRLGNWLTVNGLTEPVFTVRGGARVRLRAANVANARMLAFAFPPGAVHARIVALDGQPSAPEDVGDGGFQLAPAQRADLILDVLAAPGSEIPVYEVSTRERIQAASLRVDPGPPLRDRPPGADVRLPANDVPAPGPLGDAQVIPMLMEGGAMGGLREATFEGKVVDIRTLARKGKVWAFNGVVGKPPEPLARIPLGRAAVIDMINRTAFPHAMHLHGFHFRVVERNGKRVASAPWRDTELVEVDERVKIAFVADNPGKWLFHCHMLEHQAAGMLTWFEVG